jgi:hypothetical protein
MERASANILVSELKELLLLLKNFGPDVGLRVRLQGEMWSDNFMQLSGLINHQDGNIEAFSGIILEDEMKTRTVVIRDLKRIIQFELDKRFKDYQPYIHYTVVLFLSESVHKK